MISWIAVYVFADGQKISLKTKKNVFEPKEEELKIFPRSLSEDFLEKEKDSFELEDWDIEPVSM